MVRSRSRSRSSSRSSSSSEDSVEREEREQKERERREQKAYEKEQRRIAKEKARAAKEKARIEEAAIEKAFSLQWRFSIPQEDGADSEDFYEITLLAKKKAYHGSAVVDVQDWEKLVVYLRDKFEIDDSIKRISLTVKVELEGEVKLRKKNVCDEVTLANMHADMIDLSVLLLEATEAKVFASISSLTTGKKLKAKVKERTRKQEEASAKWIELKKSIYGSTAGTKFNSYTTGRWTTESSDIMRREHNYMNTYYETRELSEKVMGGAATTLRPMGPHPRIPWDPLSPLTPHGTPLCVIR
jgi:hypothetical protein